QMPELFVVRADGLDSKPLGVTDAEVLAISPAGEMAVKTNRKQYWFFWEGTLGRVSILGGTPREVLDGVLFADYAADGRLAVVRRAGGVARQAGGKVVLEFPIGNRQRETTGWMSYPRVSPDGKQIAFFDHALPGLASGFLTVMSVDGASKRITSE